MAYFEGIEMTGGYGNGPDIISSCSVNVNKGEIVSILGPNGAGKSTAMKAMLGLLNLKSGSVKIDGKDISKLSPQDRVKQGISFVPQTKNVFAGMTVEENLEMGAFLVEDEIKNIIEEIYDLFPILREKRNQMVGELSGGQRQAVAIARSTAFNAKVVIMDEPTAALAIKEVGKVLDLINSLKKTGVGVIVISHRMDDIFSVCDRVMALFQGTNFAESELSNTSRDEVIGWIMGKK